MSCHMFRWLTIAMLASAACGPTHAKRLADGSYAIECNTQKVCLDRADRQCGPTGYTIVGGEHNQKVFGVNGNEKQVGTDELHIRCKGLPAPDSVESNASSPDVTRIDGGTVLQPSPTNNSVCRPGETQKCFGAGACAGGQSCTPDGAGFGPCDCGPSSNTHGTKHP
jgi:hypothetical protein